MTEQMTIGQLGMAAGVNVETVRYYQRRELLAPPDRLSCRIGRYPRQTLTSLDSSSVRSHSAFSLGDVEALLSLDDGQACTAAKAIGEHMLAGIRQRIQTLRALETALQRLVAQCSRPKRKMSCPLIQALVQSD